MKFLVFCESDAEFRTVRGLVERVVRDEGPSWVKEHLESYPLESLCEWVGDGSGISFFDVHLVYKYAQDKKYARGKGLRLPHSRFDGSRAAPGYLMTQTALLVAREEAKISKRIDAVILVWDADDQGDARRKGFKQTRTTARPDEQFRVVLGCSDMEREAWVLAGFEPEHKTEQQRLDEERRALGFCPSAEAYRLRDKDDHTPRSPKRALASLMSGDSSREERCWMEAPLDRLKQRGESSGLKAFLVEIGSELVPLVSSGPSPS